jgi:3-deoxy-D-manno-octulosonate 8-phosphate phosphatase (KDO 8-P phosphatase)
LKTGLIVFDFDGVLTDNRVLVLDNGQEAVFCNRSDGMAIEALRRAGIPVVIMSKETSPVVAARARKLQIQALQALDDKATALEDFCKERGISLDAVVYVGNDLNDKHVMSKVGHRVCPSDAHPAIRAISHTVLRTAGGYGVARELVEDVLGISGWTSKTHE